MRKIILLLTLLVTSSCASTMESLQIANTQNLLIETPHVEGAECHVSDKGGRKWNLWDTPGTVAVQEGHPPLVVICSKKGFKTSVLTINEHKEELLTIDGQHIDVSIYGDFPTKFPRLIPVGVKETAGFLQDPTGHLSTTYPDSIIVWMEPKKWESEDQMREWAFDREVADRAEFINEEDAKANDEHRKEKRRKEQEIRENKIHNVAKNLKKGINPAPAIEQGFKNTVKIINPAPAADKIIEDGIGNPLPVLRETVSKGIKDPAIDADDKMQSANPSRFKNYFNERNDAREKVREERALDDAKAKAGSGDTSVIDDSAPQDIFSSGDSKTRYKKVYSGDDGAKYDENGNHIVK